MAKSFKRFQKSFCRCCRTYRKQPYCSESERLPDCPWKDRTPEPRWPGDENMKVCPCCGRDFFVPCYNIYAYKKVRHTSGRNTVTEYYCGWNCMRKEEKNIERICDDLKLSGY